jgi:hypothetical protein
MKRLRSLTGPDASVDPTAPRSNPAKRRKTKKRNPRRALDSKGWIA